MAIAVGAALGDATGMVGIDVVSSRVGLKVAGGTVDVASLVIGATSLRPPDATAGREAGATCHPQPPDRRITGPRSALGVDWSRAQRLVGYPEPLTIDHAMTRRRWADVIRDRDAALGGPLESVD
ncbi:MAG: hypothetical protein AVDCRST_MAG70-221 [uncultured Thermomicrobiales bacterium]|uniref:Uncharacterized protein n=1 Tax=uncultured Thermomicrobiales bacterium TaxID=1645740 RepID=A0A6J4U9P0_9BACT|nr:MAG: hypothetical protein AVDCRST_MAG70-221 [uncultured Thermomicrobiales bacterium]